MSRTMIAIGGYDRALALSSQAFGALVPLLLLVSLAVDNPGRAVTGAELTRRPEDSEPEQASASAEGAR